MMRLLRQFAIVHVLLRRNDKVVVNTIFTKDLTYLAPIAMETKNVPIVSGHFFVVMDSGKDVYGNAQTVRF